MVLWLAKGSAHADTDCTSLSIYRAPFPVENALTYWKTKRKQWEYKRLQFPCALPRHPSACKAPRPCKKLLTGSVVFKHTTGGGQSVVTYIPSYVLSVFGRLACKGVRTVDNTVVATDSHMHTDTDCRSSSIDIAPLIVAGGKTHYMGCRFSSTEASCLQRVENP